MILPSSLRRTEAICAKCTQPLHFDEPAPLPQICAECLEETKCPLDKKYGEIVCRKGILWELTYSECAPPDQRQAVGECDICRTSSISSQHQSTLGETRD